MGEVDDTIMAAQLEINAHRLGLFINDPANREAIQKRKKELLDEATLVDFVKFDVLTQAAIIRLFSIMEKEPGEYIFDMRVVLGVGYILGREIGKEE